MTGIPMIAAYKYHQQIAEQNLRELSEGKMFKFLSALHGEGFICPSKIGKFFSHNFEGLKEMTPLHRCALKNCINSLAGNEEFLEGDGLVIVVNQNLDDHRTPLQIEQAVAILSYSVEGKRLKINNVALMPAMYRTDIFTGVVRHLLSKREYEGIAVCTSHFAPLPAFDKAVGMTVERLCPTKEFNLDIITDGTYLLFF